jgi:hypothetical protein
VRALVFAHKNVATALVPPTLLNPGVDGDHYDGLESVGAVQQSLATLLVLTAGGVAGWLGRTGSTAGYTVRERLFGCAGRGFP